MPSRQAVGIMILPAAAACFWAASIGGLVVVAAAVAMVSSQVDSGFGHQRGEFGDEVRGLDKISRSDFEQPQAGPKGGEQDARSNITCVVPSR